MSELIANNTEKQESLKNIVRDLSEGSDIKSVQKQFKKLLRMSALRRLLQWSSH